MMNEIRPFVFRYGIHGFQDFFMAFGTIMFAFGGASTFPTIQNDMADKTKFGKSLHYSFLGKLQNNIIKQTHVGTLCHSKDIKILLVITVTTVISELNR